MGSLPEVPTPPRVVQVAPAARAGGWSGRASSMKAMILAAGEGTRLRPMTLDRPKPMLPLSGRPVLEHTLAWLRHHGIRQVAINVHYQPDKIMDHFKDGIRFGMELTYSVEARLLGTAGAVKRLADYFSDAPFVVVYGDVITDLELSNLVAFHAERPLHPAITLSLYRVANPTECGIADLDREGRLCAFVEKPRPGEVFSDLASAGVLVVDPAMVATIPEGVA